MNKHSKLGHFLFYYPIKGGYLSPMDPGMGVHIYLREMLAYGKVKNIEFQKLPGQQFGVCLREVSVSGGSTVLYLLKETLQQSLKFSTF